MTYHKPSVITPRNDWSFFNALSRTAVPTHSEADANDSTTCFFLADRAEEIIS